MIDIAQAAQAILIVSASVIGLALLFVGLGLGFHKLGRAGSVNADRILTSFWMGLAAAICLLQAWHLAFAVTRLVLGILAFASAAGFWWNRAELSDFVKQGRRGAFVWILGGLAILAWVANHAAGPATAVDSGIYHIQAIRWSMEYPAVLGLGNLNERLAFNASSLLYDAMLGGGGHLGNCLLVWMFFVRGLLSATRVASGAGLSACVFQLVLVAPVVAITVSNGISSPTADIPVVLVLFVAAMELYALLKTETPAHYDFVVVATLAALTICLKSSAIIVAPILIAIALALSFRTLPKDLLRTGLSSAVVAFALLVPWCLHGLLLSGYPMYPSRFGGIAADWRLPAELANASRVWVIAAARNSTAPGFAWLPTWIRWISREHWPSWSSGLLAVFLPVAVTCALIVLSAADRKRRERTHDRGWWLVAGCAMAAIAWLVTAPSPRFGFAILWSLAAATAAQAAAVLQGASRRRLILPAAMALGFVAILFPLPDSSIVRGLARRLVVPPGPDHGLWPYPVAELSRFTTESGLTLLVPVNDSRCFDAPLLCTPYPAPNLVLTRVLGRPKFVTHGAWRPMYWPNRDPAGREFLELLKSQTASAP